MSEAFYLRVLLEYLSTITKPSISILGLEEVMGESGRFLWLPPADRTSSVGSRSCTLPRLAVTYLSAVEGVSNSRHRKSGKLKQQSHGCRLNDLLIITHGF